MWSSPAALAVTSEQRRTLETWLRAHSTPQSVATRVRIVLQAAEGKSNNAIAKALGVSRPTVILWRERFASGGPTTLTEVAPGRGRKRSVPQDLVTHIVEATQHTKPPGATHWTTRTMAKAQGVSHTFVRHVWEAHGLQPHRVKTFKLSRDPRFVGNIQALPPGRSVAPARVAAESPLPPQPAQEPAAGSSPTTVSPTGRDVQVTASLPLDSQVLSASTSDRSRYAAIPVPELLATSKELLHQPVQASGSIFLVRVVGDGEHVQIQTRPDEFVWAFFDDKPTLAKGQKVSVYGAFARVITITGADRKQHQQPVIEPVDSFETP